MQAATYLANHPTMVKRQGSAEILSENALQGAEHAIGKLKRVALPCEKTAESYSAIVAFACTMILVRSVHTA